MASVNGERGKRYTQKDYDDIQSAMNALKSTLHIVRAEVRIWLGAELIEMCVTWR